MSDIPRLYTKQGTANSVPERYQYTRRRSLSDDATYPLGVSVLEAGKLTQNAGTMADTTVGSTFNGIPTILSAAGVSYTDGNLVVAKVEYEAVDDTDEESDWITTAITFEVYAAGSIPADTVPAFTGDPEEWTTGVYHMTWATTDSGDGSVTATETGPCRMVYCSSTDVRVVT